MHERVQEYTDQERANTTLEHEVVEIPDECAYVVCAYPNYSHEAISMGGWLPPLAFNEWHGMVPVMPLYDMQDDDDAAAHLAQWCGEMSAKRWREAGEPDECPLMQGGLYKRDPEGGWDQIQATFACDEWVQMLISEVLYEETHGVWH